MKQYTRLLTTILLFLLFLQVFPQNSYYLDPVHGSLENDGTQQSPLPSLEVVFANDMIESQMWNEHLRTGSSVLIPKNENAKIKGGDTLYLLEGYYVSIDIRYILTTSYRLWKYSFISIANKINNCSSKAYYKQEIIQHCINHVFL